MLTFIELHMSRVVAILGNVLVMTFVLYIIDDVVDKRSYDEKWLYLSIKCRIQRISFQKPLNLSLETYLK